MLNNQPLDGLPLWAVYLLTVLVMLAAMEGGYQLGKVIKRRWPDGDEAGVSSIAGATLALLTFLMAFVIGYGVNLFNERRQLVISEANAIGTTYLRAGYLDEPYRTESRDLLRDYVDSRLSAQDTAQVTEAWARSAQIHYELWRRVEIVARENASPTVALYIASLNEVIDLFSERTNLRQIRFPLNILLGLYFIAALAMFLVGLRNSYVEKRNWIPQIVLVLVLSIVFLLIIDLDRTQEGLIRIPQKAFIDLQQQLNNPPWNTP